MRRRWIITLGSVVTALTVGLLLWPMISIEKDLESARQALISGHYAEAESALESASASAPHRPDLLVLRGRLHLARYEWDAALTDLDRAVTLDPAYAPAWFARGLLYASVLQTGQALHAQALADFEHYLTLAPQGEFAAEAARYAADLRASLQAMDGP